VYSRILSTFSGDLRGIAGKLLATRSVCLNVISARDIFDAVQPSAILRAATVA
jgi:hypothetical protein